MSEEIAVFENKSSLVDAVTIDLMNDLKGEIEKYNLALSGGNTPRTIYEQWATIRDDTLWSKAHFFWGDERCVPPDDNDSNYKMAYEAFLSKINMKENQIHRIRGEADPEMEAKRYGDEIRNHLPAINGLPRFDWILLGVGTDGHTASLFPNAENKKKLPEVPSLREVDVCVVAQHPQTGQKRISLTLPVINNAKKVTFLVTGDEKAQIVHEIFSHSGENKSSDYPAAQVKPKSGILQWYLDEAAASLL